MKRVSPETLVVLDGVCAVASEEIRMDDWNIDVVRDSLDCMITFVLRKLTFSYRTGCRRFAKGYQRSSWCFDHRLLATFPTNRPVP